jgi:hypothetical protein
MIATALINVILFIIIFFILLKKTWVIDIRPKMEKDINDNIMNKK